MIMNYKTNINIPKEKRQEELRSFFQEAKEKVLLSKEPTYVHGFFFKEDMDLIEIEFQLFPFYIGRQTNESGCIYAKYMIGQSSVI